MVRHLHCVSCICFVLAFIANSPALAQSSSDSQTPGGIALVQKAGFTDDTAASISQAYIADNTAGHLLVALVASIGTDGYDITGVTDSQGNTWMQAGRETPTSSIWYARNCKAGANTVTIAKFGSVSRGFIAVAEYSGAAQTGVVLDQTNYGASYTSTLASDTMLLGYNGALIVTMFNSNSAAQNWTSPTAGFNIEAGANASFTAWADNQNSINGQNPFEVTLGGGSDAWDLKMAAFLPATLPAPTAGYNFIRVSESLNKTLSPSPGSPSQSIFPGGNNPGDLILVVCNQFFPSADQITSVTDTVGDSYTELFSASDSFLRTFTDVYAANGSMGSNIRNAISCNFTSANVTDSVDTMAIEYSGQAAGNILDTSASTDSTGTSLSYSITPASAGELLFSVNVTDSGPNTWSGLGIETDREPSLGNSNNETRMADLLSSPSGASTITVTRAADGLAGFTLALKAEAGAVLQPSNLSASISPNPINELGTFTVDGTLPGVAGLPAPTGVFSIDVEAGGASYTASTEVGSRAPSLSVDANHFPVGSAAISVSYSGDGNYAPANITLPLTVTEPFAVSGTPATIAPGAIANNTSTVTVSPLGAFVGTVNFSCGLLNSSVPIGAEFPPTCTIPASANITGAGAVTAAMTIVSTAPGASASIVPSAIHEQWIAADTAAGLFVGMVFFAMPSQRRRRSLFSFLFFWTLVSVLVACGSSGGASQNAGTTPGTYIFVVSTAVPGPNNSALSSVNANVTVTIQ